MTRLRSSVIDALGLAKSPDWAFLSDTVTLEGNAAITVHCSCKTLLGRIQSELTSNGYNTTLTIADGDHVLIVEEA